MEIPVESEVVNRIDFTPIAIAIVKVMLKPYNDLLDQLLEDGRVTQAELDQLREQMREQGKRLDELLPDEISRAKASLSEIDAEEPEQ